MNREQALGYAMSLEDTVSDKPFREDFDSTVFRHKATKKWFGLIMDHKGQDYLNLKCEPEYSDFMKKQFEGKIIEAYHMNKKLWITVILDTDIPDDEVKNLIRHSYQLTKKKK